MTTPTKIVELLGPAGVGKSTLARTLCEGYDEVIEGITPHRMSASLRFAATLLRLAPSLCKEHLGSRRLNRTEMRAIYLLGGWEQQIEQVRRGTATLTVMDHGPMFRLTYLRVFGPTWTTAGAFDRWWHEMLDVWSVSLDSIVVLEADNAELICRVRRRDGRSSRFQARSDTSAQEFLDRYRRGFDEVLALAARYGAPKILTFNSQKQSAPAIAASIIDELSDSKISKISNICMTQQLPEYI